MIDDARRTPVADRNRNQGTPARRGSYLLTTERHATQSPTSWVREQHDLDELIWTTAGVTHVRADGAIWTIPSSHGIWIPRGVHHTIESSAGTLLHATFFQIEAVAHLPAAVTVVELLPAVRELLLLNAEQEMADATRLRLQELVIDLLQPAPASHVDLRMPESPWLLLIAERILAELDSGETTQQWAARSGVPTRSLTRAFVAETGYSLAQWRIRARIRASLVLLGSGLPVVSTARRLGYASTSTFIDHFRSIVGSTPGAYFDARR